MKIIIACKPPIEKLPPIQTLLHILLKNRFDIVVVTTHCENKLRDSFEEKGVKIIEVKTNDMNVNERKLISKRIIGFYKFNRLFWKTLSSSKIPPDVIWVSSGDSAISIGSRLFNYKYILQLNELYDKYPHYKLLLGNYAKKASIVVVPEQSRAGILRYWYNLKMTPIALPNKPFQHPRIRKLEISNFEVAKIISKNTKPIVLYQGIIEPNRDLAFIASALHPHSNKWTSILLGWNGKGDKFFQLLSSIWSSAIFIPSIPSPRHLEVTSHAHIGIAPYSFHSLNDIFCAPNKIWEYAGFGIPVICSDVPGLRNTIHNAGAGICCDLSSPSCIISSLHKIESNYMRFSKNAQIFFDSIDIEAIVNNILLKAL